MSPAFAMLIAAIAGAVEPQLVIDRVTETAALRSQRIGTRGPAIPMEDYRLAAAGEIVTGLLDVEGHSSKISTAIGVLKVPIGELFATIVDDIGKVGTTKLSYVQILSGSNCKQDRVVFQYLPTPFIVADRWWVNRYAHNTALQKATQGRVREMTWRADGGDIPSTGQAYDMSQYGVRVTLNEGSWFLIDIDGSHTIVEYYAWNHPGGRIPPGLAAGFSSSANKLMLRSMAEPPEEALRCPVE